MADEELNNDIEIDQIYQEATGELDPGPTQENIIETKTQTIQELELNVNGKPIKVKYDDPKLKTWAQMGYEAPNKIGELNNRLKGLEETNKKYADYDTKYANYKQFDEWCAKNPDGWKSIEQIWREKQNSIKTPDGKEAQLPPEIVNTINELKQDREARLIKEQEEIRQTANSTLDNDIKSMRESFPHLDFDAKGEDGKSFLKKVLEHGINNNIANFKTAFRDYYFDDAVKNGQEKGKEQITKTIQKNSRLGLLGTTPAPKKGNSSALDLRGMSPNEVHRMALEELGLA